MIRIKQVSRLLGYGDPQVLEVFKNTVPNWLYWVLFAIDNLHDAVETAKRFLTKVKIDRQMTGQNSTPFMRMIEKKRKSVSFDANDVLEKTNENMEKMTALMDKMYIKLEQKCKSNILFNRTNIFRDKTSFCQFLTWLLPGLKKMLILIISNTEGVKVLVCPAILDIDG